MIARGQRSVQDAKETLYKRSPEGWLTPAEMQALPLEARWTLAALRRQWALENHALAHGHFDPEAVEILWRTA